MSECEEGEVSAISGIQYHCRSEIVGYEVIIKELTRNIIITLFVILPGIVFSLDCKPTATDALEPFYKPIAPVRSGVGKGYVLTDFGYTNVYVLRGGWIE